MEIINLHIRYDSARCFSVTTELFIDENVPNFVESDVIRLRQVLINLLLNAYKHTYNGFIKIFVKLENTNENYDEILVVYINSSESIK